MTNHWPCSKFRLTFAQRVVNMESASKAWASGAAFGKNTLPVVAGTASILNFGPEGLPANSAIPFQCGKQAAHRCFGAATTTAELEIVSRTGGSQRQCFAVCNPEFRQASNRLHLFRRIVKKLTNSLWEPNRPESRVPKSDEPSFIRDVAKERTVFFPFALRPRITGI